MAITLEMLNGNASLSALTDEQKQGIVTLSANDENRAVGEALGKVHGRYDADFERLSGIARDQGEKTYAYANRVIETLQSQKGDPKELEAANAKVKDLEEQIKKGNPALSAQLEAEKARAAALEAQVAETKTSYEAKITDLQTQMVMGSVNNQFDSAVSATKFVPGLSENLINLTVDAAKKGVLAEYTPSMVELNGENTLVFKDKDGNIAYNQSNLSKPFTASELLLSKLDEAIDKGKQQQGAGTNPPQGAAVAGKTGGAIDLSGATTQVAADEAIAKYLATEGVPQGTAEFTEKQMELREANGVADLPVS